MLLTAACILLQTLEPKTIMPSTMPERCFTRAVPDSQNQERPMASASLSCLNATIPAKMLLTKSSMKTNARFVGGVLGRVRAHGIVFLLLFNFIAGIISAFASTDYGPAIWRPCYSSHLYTSGYGHRFHVIHDMEGYYLSSISYFQKSTTQASVHYFTNGKKDYGSDANPGEVSQGVREAFGIGNLRGRGVYLACIPTTAGTGAGV